MKKFKTIHVIEVVTGRGLVKKGTFRGLVGVILFMCRIETPQNEVSMEKFYAINKLNKKNYIKTLFEQYPALISIVKESERISNFTPDEWCSWAEEKSKILGEELELTPCDSSCVKMVNLIQIPAQQPELN